MAMRKLKLQMQMTVDGFVAGPEGQLDWMTRSPDDRVIVNGLIQARVGAKVEPQEVALPPQASAPEAKIEQPNIRWPEAGEQVEGFKVVRELGRGAFARAYLAEDPDTGNRPVVLKLSPKPSVEAKTLFCR